ncbi:MAG: hypothetical protein IID41_08555 [Planctomycetes bacterium]|nr:hypothetical protein [Planctomycetota bacterium]
MSEVTRILEAIERGDTRAASELLPLVYDQLRREAQRRMAGERSDHTLQATALVHEAYLRLVGDQQIHWQNRAHFYAAAAEAMRRILIEEARRKKAARHGGGRQRIELSDSLISSSGAATNEDGVDLEALSTATPGSSPYRCPGPWKSGSGRSNDADMNRVTLTDGGWGRFMQTSASLGASVSRGNGVGDGRPTRTCLPSLRSSDTRDRRRHLCRFGQCTRRCGYRGQARATYSAVSGTNMPSSRRPPR